MDRRTSLAVLTGRLATQKQTATVVTGLEPYTGPWERQQAIHLLRRASFGPNRKMIEEAMQLGFAGTMAKLFEDQPLPAEPVIYQIAEPVDPIVNPGESWVDAHYAQGENLQGQRNRSLRAWTLGLMLDEGISVKEKMTLFWHNHFAISDENEPNMTYRYINTLRSQCLGNFRQLVKDITIDPAMLRFLNGNQNTRFAPNENYARELLELFTIGKGPAVGPGDYTNYTEKDVEEMAKVLTGWRFRGRFKTEPDAVLEAYYTENRHETADKQLSHRFNNIVISNGGEQEYAQLIDIIFQQEEVSNYICRKLYRWFVYYIIDDNAEANVIAPMAQMLRDNDYDVFSVVQALLGSAHFFDMQVRGPMIKHPYDFAISILKNLELPITDEIEPRYRVLLKLFRDISTMQMEYYQLPSVAGWQAYYQEPQFYRTWINATTLQVRAAFASRLAANGFVNFGIRYKLEPLQLIATFEEALDVNRLLDQLGELCFPMPLTDGQRSGLKEILIPGLPDFEWTVEYSEYLADPDNEDIAASVDAKLRAMLDVMLNVAEFQLI